MNTRYLVPIVLFLGACDPGQEPAALTGEDAIDYPTYAARVWRAGCATLFDCCDATDRETLGGPIPYADYDACLAGETGYAATTEQIVAMIASGAVTYDGAAAAACAAEAETASCAQRSEWIGRATLCTEILVGTAPLGAACDATTAVCESGICDNGVCVARPSRGEACDGFFCEDRVCTVDGVCGSLAPEGAPCVRDLQCEDGLYCVGAAPDEDIEGTCAPIDRCLGT